MNCLRPATLFVVLFSAVLFLSLGAAGAMEPETDRPGMDYRSFDLPSPDPGPCEAACGQDALNCKAWTYVKPNVQGPRARCWLKSGVPPAVRNASCISGVMQHASPTAEKAPPERRSTIQPVAPAGTAGARPERPESRAGLPHELQRETEPFQGIQAGNQPSQVPKNQVFEAMAAQRLQSLKASKELERRNDLQRREADVSSITANVLNSLLLCDPQSQTLQVKYVHPQDIHPGDPVVIDGCNFQSNDGQSEAVMTAAANPYGPFWNFSSMRPKSYKLRIDSWTDTVIKAHIPGYDYLLDGIPPIDPFADTIPVKLEVHKGQKYDFQKNAYVPEKVSSSSALQLRPLTEVKNAPDFTKVIVTDQNAPKGCFSLKDYTQSMTDGSQIPRILHFTTSTDAGLQGSGAPGDCKGKDQINFQNFILPANIVFYDYQFQYQCMTFDASGAGSWVSNCPQYATLDQALGNIKGKTLLPNVTVSWQHNKHAGGIAYQLVITVEGPKGIVW